MKQGATSGGLKKRRNLATLARADSTTQIISIALPGRYCSLDRRRNGCSDFVNMSTL
jgi:hypothetical protein